MARRRVVRGVVVFTVRYPTGLAVTYNRAGYLVYLANGGFELYKRQDGPWVVTIQAGAGAAVESQRACRSEFEAMTVEKAARYLAERPEELKALPIYIARDLKRALTAFNAKTGSWS